jgi:hypothetical protein
MGLVHKYSSAIIFSYIPQNDHEYLINSSQTMGEWFPTLWRITVPLKHQELHPLMAQRYVSEDFYLQKHGCKNLKTHMISWTKSA